MSKTLELGIGIYRALETADLNLLLSPFSIWSALAMLEPGAAGVTSELLRDILGIENAEAAATLNRELASRATQLHLEEDHLFDDESLAGEVNTPPDFGFHLEIANKLWVAGGYNLKPVYEEALRDFGAEASPLDFSDPVAASNAINHWAARATRDKIKGVISPANLSTLTRSVLANATYFKAAWQAEFDETRTRPRRFFSDDGSERMVPTMSTTGAFRCASRPEYQVVEIPYIHDSVSMAVIAPTRGTFADFDSKLSSQRLERVLGETRYREIELHLPSFAFESALQVAGPLADLGLRPLFDGEASDFSGISDEPLLALDSVGHVATIDVNEQGTEAAAVTVVAIAGSSGPLPKPEPFYIDRPFYLLIYDRPTKAALFFGRVAMPSLEEGTESSPSAPREP